MPKRPNTPCKHPGCAKLVPYGTMYCEEHRAAHPEVIRSASKRGYNARWRKASKLFLQAYPLCAECMKQTPPRYVKATIVDHIEPHRGDQKLFWDRNNWQPLCKRCHDRKTMTEDRYQTFKY